MESILTSFKKMPLQKAKLTHRSPASFLWDTGKQSSLRCDDAKRGVPSWTGVPSGTVLIAILIKKNEIKMKNITPGSP